MNFAAMLQATVTPLANIEPACQKRQRQVASIARARELADAAIVHEDAIAKYKTAWLPGEEWVKTSVVDKRLGYTSARETLRRWEKQGIVESRRVTGVNGRHKRSMGIEWRWK